MSCCPTSTPSSCCTPAQQCYPENFGLDFPSLVGPMGPPGGPGTYVESLAALRVLDATIFTQGYIANVGGHTTYNDQGGGLFIYDPTGVAADNDGTIVEPANGIGRWLRLFQGPVSVRWFGALGDGVTDDHAAIQGALDAYDSIWFPPGNYLVSTVIRATRVVNIGGDPQATITAAAGFTGIAITRIGVPETLKALIAVFAGTNIGEQTDPRIGDSGIAVSIGPMLLNCNNQADYSLVLNSAPGAMVRSKASYANQTGIWIGSNGWGTYLEHNRVTDCVTSGIYIGEAGNGCTFYCPEIWGHSITTGVGIYLDGTPSGVVGTVGQALISGGYIEKCVTGIYIKDTGSTAIHSVDIEGITGNCVYFDCTAGASTAFGVIDGSNLSSLGNAVYNVNATISVMNCSIADGGTLEPFLSASPFSLFEASGNFFYSGPAPSAPPLYEDTQTILATQSERYGYKMLNKRLTDGALAFSRSWALFNMASDSQPNEISSAIECRNSRVGGADLQYWASVVMRSNITHSPGGINPAVKKTSAVVLDYGAGEVPQFYPERHDEVDLGTSATRWHDLYISRNANFGGTLVAGGTLRGVGGLLSGDGSVGITGNYTLAALTTMQFKNGLLVATT